MKYVIKANVRLYPGMAGWHFVSVDKKVSEKIRKSRVGTKRNGWGSVPVTATMRKTRWKTSIFPDKGGTYLLPLKADIRKREDVGEGDLVRITLVL